MYTLASSLGFGDFGFVRLTVKAVTATITEERRRITGKVVLLVTISSADIIRIRIR